jgi:hypothetical protein
MVVNIITLPGHSSELHDFLKSSCPNQEKKKKIEKIVVNLIIWLRSDEYVFDLDAKVSEIDPCI